MADRTTAMSNYFDWTGALDEHIRTRMRLGSSVANPIAVFGRCQKCHRLLALGSVIEVRRVPVWCSECRPARGEIATAPPYFDAPNTRSR